VCLLIAVDRHEEALCSCETLAEVLSEEDRRLSQMLPNSKVAFASDGRPCPDSRGDVELRLKEIGALLAAALYNCWATCCHLGQQRLAAEHLHRADSFAQRRLGEAHPLTVKVSRALSVVLEISEKHSLSVSSKAASTCPGGWRGADADFVPRITLRGPLYSNAIHAPSAAGPLRPTGRAPLQKRLQRLRVKEHLYGRGMHPIVAGNAGPLLGEGRSLASDAGRRVGSAVAAALPKDHSSKLMAAADLAGGTSPCPDPSRLQAIQSMKSRSPRNREDQYRAAVRIQAAARGYLVRSWIAPVLTSHFRRRSHHGDSSRCLALEVVGVARGALVRHHAAAELQRTWRGWRTRRHIKAEVARLARAGTVRVDGPTS